MKVIIVFVALFVVVWGAPRPLPAGEVTIVRSESDVGPESYKYDFETSDGTKANQEGQLQNVGSENESLSVKGEFSYVGDDGVTYTVHYTADENGYQPQGEHLPHAPAA